MKQPRIRIESTDGEMMGDWDVFSVTWDKNGKITHINVDMFGLMIDQRQIGLFTNIHGNLKGILIEKEQTNS